jgi:hypothetical protein
MNTNKKLKKIEKNTFNMGNKAYETYSKTGSLSALKCSVDAYKTSMQSIRYQLIYNNLKK